MLVLPLSKKASCQWQSPLRFPFPCADFLHTLLVLPASTVALSHDTIEVVVEASSIALHFPVLHWPCRSDSTCIEFGVNKGATSSELTRYGIDVGRRDLSNLPAA
jgi:hypothetical protein